LDLLHISHRAALGGRARRRPAGSGTRIVRPEPRTHREESRRAVPIGSAWPPTHPGSGVVCSLPAAPLSAPPGLCSSRPMLAAGAG